VTEWCPSICVKDQYMCFRLDWHISVLFPGVANGSMDTDRLTS
jgi:hypothetical protein